MEAANAKAHEGLFSSPAEADWCSFSTAEDELTKQNYRTLPHAPTCTHTGPTVRQQTQQTVKPSLLRISNNRTFRVREKE